MRIMPGGIIRKLKINSCAYSGGPTEIQKPGVIPSVQALEVRDDHQCNILLERVGQEEEDIRSTWPHSTCGMRLLECWFIALCRLIE